MFEFTAPEGVNLTCGGDPYSIFVEFFDDEIIEHIANETNIYAQQYINLNSPMPQRARAQKWKATNKSEIYTLLCFMILQSIA